LKVKFLIDECTGKRLAIMLKNAGYDVVFVGDWKHSASDDEVLRKANEEGRILITDDKDFGELVFRLRKPSSGIILIRTSTTNPATRFDLLEILLKSTDADSKFIVLKDNVIKIRDT
jgi:predicted nuclease of predicted toxin-antitoxin system